MAHPVFFSAARPMSIAAIAELTKADLLDPARGDFEIGAVATLLEAGPRHIAFYDNIRYADDLSRTVAGACLVGPRFADQVPSGTVVLRSRKPFAAFVEIARHFHEQALRPTSGFGLSGIAVSAVIHPQAQLEDDVIIDPLAVVGPGAEIGADTVIGSGAVIGAGVRIGRNCSIGAGVTIQHALIGNNVIIHPGCHIGQDGFGFVFVDGKHRKVPQTGRVIIQQDVEIGAGSAIDRGSVRDTVIGEGTKIDNQVQIGHNVWIGRHCIVAGQCGLSGSMSIGDHVSLGARAGVNNHVHIGDGAQIAALSAVAHDVPANARWGGVYAKPAKQWIREMHAVQKLGLASHQTDIANAGAGHGGPDATGKE